MKVTIDIPTYSEESGFVYRWDDDFRISVKIINDKVQIISNKEGLISLARHLLCLSQDEINSGYHLHLDAYNSLEDGSNELIIEKE